MRCISRASGMGMGCIHKSTGLANTAAVQTGTSTSPASFFTHIKDRPRQNMRVYLRGSSNVRKERPSGVGSERMPNI